MRFGQSELVQRLEHTGRSPWVEHFHDGLVVDLGGLIDEFQPLQFSAIGQDFAFLVHGGQVQRFNVKDGFVAVNGAQQRDLSGGNAVFRDGVAEIAADCEQDVCGLHGFLWFRGWRAGPKPRPVISWSDRRFRARR